MIKIRTVAPLACAFGLLLVGCKDKEPAPGGAAPAKSFDLSGAAANTLETTGKKLKFATVMYDPRVPNFIDPCFFVQKQLRENAIKKDRFIMQYSISYMSGGRQVTKNATTRVSQSVDHVHEDADHDEDVPTKKNLVSLKDHIDVTGQIPDVGTAFTGTATLVKTREGNELQDSVEETDALGGQ